MSKGAVPQQSSQRSLASTYNDESEIARFYQDRVVFITGGTGFIGKVFQRLERDAPDARNKVTAVEGDLALPDLGISKADLATLVEEVSVVFHMAATVRFNEPLKSSEEKRVGSKRKLRFGQPNNYALTKAVTESLLLDEQKELPLAIVRPAVVTASWKEPFPVAMGLLPSVLLSKDCIADLIPVDVVANTIICVGWQVAKIRPTQLKVYNCASSTLQPHTWGEVNEQVKRTVMQYPLPHTRRFSRYIATSSKVLYRLSLCFLCYVPAFFGDLALRLTGKKASNVALYRKIIKGMDVMHFYTTNSWLFRSQNFVALMSDLSPTDKQLFDIDVRKMDWCQYWDHYMLGIHKYLLKIDDLESSQERGQV
ncbi:hypothetical protein HPB50_004819 [Hyalomma asiaticum]|uniref:Uncharacterized protein n=1 Tax=Hyalomma asiaticum TaxID=266040 RepID=A0ACB7SKT8_HYAAI|nr:hypothetical protein HPB50_004819 [Hyalomma asiaticum]